MRDEDYSCPFCGSASPADEHHANACPRRAVRVRALSAAQDGLEGVPRRASAADLLWLALWVSAAMCVALSVAL